MPFVCNLLENESLKSNQSYYYLLQSKINGIRGKLWFDLHFLKEAAIISQFLGVFGLKRNWGYLCAFIGVLVSVLVGCGQRQHWLKKFLSYQDNKERFRPNLENQGEKGSVLTEAGRFETSLRGILFNKNLRDSMTERGIKYSRDSGWQHLVIN